MNKTNTAPPVEPTGMVTSEAAREFGLIDIKDVIKIFSVGERTLREIWTRRYGFPSPYIQTLYRRKDIQDWVDAGMQE